MGRASQPWHGSNGGYTNHGCRCPLCKAAGSARQAKYAAVPVTIVCMQPCPVNL